MGKDHIITIRWFTIQLPFHNFQEKEKEIEKPKVEIIEPSEEEVVVTIEKPPEAEPIPATWDRARIFPMIFKKVRGLAERSGIELEGEEWRRRLEEDKDYLRLTLDQEEEATESTVESEEESSSDYTEYSEEESEFSYSETTEESESETPSEEEESSTAESEPESTESEKVRKNIFFARRRPVIEEVQEVKGKKQKPPEEPEEELQEEAPAEGEESELAPAEEPTDLESQGVTEEGSVASVSAEGGVGSEEESESSLSSSSSSESQSGGPWGFQVPEYDRSREASQKKPAGASSEGYNTAL